MTEEAHSRKRKKRVNPVGIIIKGLLIILLIINLWVISIGNTRGAASVGILPYSVIPILSDSMSPKIKSGDAVLVKSVDYEDIVPGDVVVYARDGELIVHEVIGKNEDQFIAKGIENTIEDLPVDKEYYRAKYIYRIPFLGGIWRISGNPLKFILLAVLIGCIIFGDQIFSAIYLRVFDRKNAEATGENKNMDQE